VYPIAVSDFHEELAGWQARLVEAMRTPADA
jgi:hypothetical protein